VLSTLLGLLEPPQSFSNPTVVRSHHSDSAPGELCPSCPRRYAPVKNIVNWENSHMPSKQSCICLTHSVHKVWKWLSIYENEATIDYHHGSALKLRNRPACRYSLTQWLVSWSIPVVPKVWVETQIRVAQGQNYAAPRRSKPELHIFKVTTACLCLSGSVGTWEKNSLLTLKMILASYCRKSSYPYFFHTLFAS